MTDRKEFDLKKVLTIAYAHLIHDTYSAFLAPLLPLMIDKIGITIFLAGLLDVVRRIPSLSNPFVGILADRFNPKWFIVAAPTVTAVVMCLAGLVDNYAMLVFLIFISGMSSAVFHVPSPGMMKKVSYGRIGFGMSFYMVGGELARSLGPLLILGSISLWGLDNSWRLIPIALASSVFIYFQLSKVEVKNQKKKVISESKMAVMKKMMPVFVITAGVITFRAAMKSALTIYLPVYLTNKDFSLWLAGISLAILQFSGAAGTFAAGYLSDRFGRRKVLVAVTVACPVLMWLFVHASGIWVIPLLIVSGVFLMASSPVLLALVHERDSEHSSLVNGVYMTINFFISSLMVILVGLLSDKLGLDLTYKISAFLALGAVPFAFMTGKK